MSIDWIKLRPFNGYVINGFEEFVCHIARAKNIKYKQHFIGVAAGLCDNKKTNTIK